MIINNIKAKPEVKVDLIKEMNLNVFLPFSSNIQENLGIDTITVTKVGSNTLTNSADKGLYFPSPNTTQLKFSLNIPTPSNKNYTIGMNLLINSSAAQFLYMCTNSSGAITSCVQYYTGRTFYGYVYNGTGNSSFQNGSYSSGKWFNYILCSDGKFYVNGTLAFTYAVSSIARSTVENVTITNSWYGNRYLANAYMNNFFIAKDRILSQQEIKTIVNLGTAPYRF